MKLLFDFLPIILFFATFKGAEHFSEGFARTRTVDFGRRHHGTHRPVFLATIVAIVATFLQIFWLKLKGQKVEPTLWISLAVIVLFGGLTLYLKNEWFIKWKPTILYWIFGAILFYGNLAKKNFIRLLMKGQIEMPDAAWGKLQSMWIGFFIFAGFVNLAVAYAFSTDVWVNFKLFGLLALTMIFTIGVAVWMTKQASEGQN